MRSFLATSHNPPPELPSAAPDGSCSEKPWGTLQNGGGTDAARRTRRKLRLPDAILLQSKKSIKRNPRPIKSGKKRGTWSALKQSCSFLSEETFPYEDQYICEENLRNENKRLQKTKLALLISLFVL